MPARAGEVVLLPYPLTVYVYASNHASNRILQMGLVP